MNKKILIIAHSNSVIFSMNFSRHFEKQKSPKVRILERKGTEDEFLLKLEMEVKKRYDQIFCEKELYDVVTRDTIDTVSSRYDIPLMNTTLYSESSIDEQTFLHKIISILYPSKSEKLELHRPVSKKGKIISDLLKNNHIDFTEIFTENKDDFMLFVPNSVFSIKGFEKIKQHIESKQSS